MPTNTRFGNIWFNGAPFGEHVLATSNLKDSIHRVSLGLRVRKVFRVSNWRGVKITAQALIFRVRRGNGYFGSKLGDVYQDKYKYFAPWPNGNPAAATARTALATAVSNWKNVLTAEQKADYNKRATRGLKMSGYNLYIREYVRANA